MNYRKRNVAFSVERERLVARILPRIGKDPSMSDGHLRLLVNQAINRSCRMPLSDRGHTTRLNMHLLSTIATEFSGGDLQSFECLCEQKRAAFDLQKEEAK